MATSEPTPKTRAPKKKYTSDSERVAAQREYLKRYHQLNREKNNERSRQYRLARKAAAATPVAEPPAVETN